MTAATTTSFDDFYADAYRSALTCAVLLVGDRDVAADVVQEAFLTAHHRWPQVGSYDRPDLWLRRVIVNRSRSIGRRRISERAAISRLSARPAAAAATHDAHDPRASDGIWEAVRALPRRQAVAVTLVYGLDMSIAQAAEVMGCNGGTVKTHLSRARARLTNELEDLR